MGHQKHRRGRGEEEFRVPEKGQRLTLLWSFNEGTVFPQIGHHPSRSRESGGTVACKPARGSKSCTSERFSARKPIPHGSQERLRGPSVAGKPKRLSCPLKARPMCGASLLSPPPLCNPVVAAPRPPPRKSGPRSRGQWGPLPFRNPLLYS